MSLIDVVKTYYLEKGFNCSEAIIHGANDYYDLKIDPEDMKMLGGFGNGMYSGQTCGALVASIAALSKKIIKTKAHDMVPELSKADQLTVKNFKKHLGDTSCAKVKPAHFSKENRCLETVTLACNALEETFNELGLS